MEFTKRGVLKAGFVASSLVFLGAVGSTSAQEWVDIVKAAEAEGTVVIYTSLVPAQADAISTAFAKAYPGIALQVVRNTEGVLIPKVQQEQAVNALAADVFSGTTYDFYAEQIENGLLAMPAGPNTRAFPADGFFQDYVSVIGALPMGMAYNTTMVTTPPTKYTDLLDPQYKGNVATMMSSASAAMTALYDFMRNEEPGFWEKFADQEPRFFPSAVPMTQSVAAGEIAATLITQPASVNSLVEQGAPIQFVLPAGDQVFGIEFLLGTFKDAPHPNAARVFADFLLSVEGQAAVNGGGMGVSRIPDVPGALPAVEIVTFDPEVYDAGRVAEINAEWEAVFKP